jgi:predicted esterase
MEAIAKDFPELAALKKQQVVLRQLEANGVIREIELRQEAGQHLFAIRLLKGFPSEGVAGATLLRVKQSLDEYAKRQDQGKTVHESFDAHLQQVADEAKRAEIKAITEEIKSELNIHTLDRMADYLRFADDAEMPAEQKLSLAISGWLLGSGLGTENLAVSLSLHQVRDAVRRYLVSTREQERDAILRELDELEGATPDNVAKLLAQMKPAVETQFPEEGVPGLAELSVPALSGEEDIRYHVQLPPEYQPYRRYPCVVTLNGVGTTPLQQIDWWCGGYNKDRQMRTGQASRHGFVVIAPQWQKPHQRKYEYSAREHAAVLYSLRDACRRFSIDTDRIFLSGHSMGGDAVWDVALAHPDLWAGAIPIVANLDKYISRYWENGKYVPMYFISGQMDYNWTENNARDLDRYLTRAGFDCTIAEFQGRGHEHFIDEIQQLFEWMTLSSHIRNFFPREFECVSMRPWDNYFWWVEVDDFPKHSMVVPAAWPQRGVKEARIEGRIYENNKLSVTSSAESVTVYLTPDIVDFDQPINLTINRRRHRDDIRPNLRVMLDDVRTRGDRLHPFWAKVTN